MVVILVSKSILLVFFLIMLLVIVILTCKQVQIMFKVFRLKKHLKLYLNVMVYPLKLTMLINSIFTEQDFRDAVDAANQKITFYGVGAHHQNNLEERHNGILTLVLEPTCCMHSTGETRQ